MFRRSGSELYLPAAALEMSIWERAAQGRRGEMRQGAGKKGRIKVGHWGSVPLGTFERLEAQTCHVFLWRVRRPTPH